MARRRRRRKSSSRFLPLFIVALVAVWLLVIALQDVGAKSGALTVPVFVAVFAILIFLLILYQRRRRLRVRAFNELLALTPAQFELAVADLLRDLGYRAVKRVGRSGDLAADISCRDKKGRSIVVQCKRYAPGAKVGSRDLQTFIGMVKVHHQADLGIFVTTSEFTAPAAELAHQHGIILIDGQRLMELVGRVHRSDVGIPAGTQGGHPAMSLPTAGDTPAATE